MPVFQRIQFYIVLGCAVGLAGLTGLVYAIMPGRADLGSPAIGGSFTMIGQDGREVTNADLAGRPYLVFFGYTHCPDFCPTALFDISAVFKELGPDKKVAALFVTVDPETCFGRRRRRKSLRRSPYLSDREKK